MEEEINTVGYLNWLDVLCLDCAEETQADRDPGYDVLTDETLEEDCIDGYRCTRCGHLFP